MGASIGPVELRTRRLLLRRFRSTDVDDALGYRNDPAFALFLPHIPQPFTREDAEMFVATNIAEWEHSPTFAIELDGCVIGTVTLDIERKHEIAMLGYAIGRHWWGNGLVSEAAEAVVGWGFAALGLAKVWAATDARNTRSVRVLERLGMLSEGCLRNHERSRDGSRTDRLMFGVLQSEWAQRRHQLSENEATALAPSSPPPLRGRDRVGGVHAPRGEGTS